MKKANKALLVFTLAFIVASCVVAKKLRLAQRFGFAKSKLIIEHLDIDSNMDVKFFSCI